MPSQLVALTEGPNILLDKPILLFGRHPECDIQIDSRKISRRHCCIAQVSDYLVVRDLGSTNGIRINGVRVLEGRLKTGDELIIGGHRYQILGDVVEAAANPMPPRRQPSPEKRPLAGKDEDELLESCDEPVPLPEARGASEPVKTPRREDFAGLIGRPHAPPPAVPTSSKDPRPGILPEEMDLLPASDVELPKPRASR